jgi:hypothetical protein
MSGATRSEAVEAGKKVLLVDELQFRDNHPLTQLIFERWRMA